MTGKLIPVFKNGKLFSVKSDKTIPVYKNGVGILEVLNQLQRQAIEMRRLEEKGWFCGGEIGRHGTLFACCTPSGSKVCVKVRVLLPEPICYEE